jgi:hypothetical protein
MIELTKRRIHDFFNCAEMFEDVKRRKWEEHASLPGQMTCSITDARCAVGEEGFEVLRKDRLDGVIE